jgi:sugar transferase (PEP-CTERM/EpsH1 system associated)
MARLALEPPLNQLPFVLDMVDVDSEKWRLLSQKTRPPFSWVYGAEARTLSAFEARAARAAHAVLVVNERERDAMQRIEPSARVQVVPIGVALDDLRPQELAATEPNVVFCGVMNYKPNEEAATWFATEVWPRVRARHPQARFSLVGSNPTPAVRRLAEQDPSIEVTGTVPDVRPYLWRSAVAVAPLLLARGVQNKVLEAVAAGLPCVITPAVHDGLPEAVLPSCVRAEHPADFADAVIALLNTAPDQRRGIAELADLQALGWDEQLAPVIDILDAARRSAVSPQSSVA